MSKVILSIFYFVLFISSSLSSAEPVPQQPVNPQHPGSNVYSYPTYTMTDEKFGDRSGTLYLPAGVPITQPLVTIAFGHGYSVPEFTYRKTFAHLARKGVAVLYVPYDTGMRDHDFVRMAKDYNAFVADVVARHPAVLQADKVVFSGHSNGATVAAMAAGLPNEDMKLRPAELLLFAVAGKHREFSMIDPKIPCTLVVGEDDTEDPPEFSEAVLRLMPCEKQLIVLKSYKDTFQPETLATHSSIRTFGWFGDQTSALHYFGYWKFLFGAAQDVNEGAKGTNKWLFGPDALDSGSPNLKNLLMRE